MTTTTSGATGSDEVESGRARMWAIALCWVAIALDGFDVVVIGAVIPTLSQSGDLGFTNASLTTASTIGVVGVAVGALGGPLTDRFGRRRCLIGCVVWFSAFTLAVAFSQSVFTFALFRFLAGLGLGAVLPTALAYMSENARSGRNAAAVTRTMTGYHVGAVLTAVLALFLIDLASWRAMFAVGGVLGLLVAPVMWAKLPESQAYLRSVSDRSQDAVELASRTSQVFRGRYVRISVGICVASFMGLVLVYGLNTWLPKIMGEAGYSIKAGIGLLLALNIGAILGLLVAGLISDSRGNKPTVLLWFGLAALFLALLSIKLESTVLVYGAVLLTGVFVFSSQVLVYALVGHLYPPEVRGTALGMSTGVGRIGAIVGPSVGGALVTAGIAYPWGFYIFAVAAVIAVLALVMVPAHAPEPVVT